MSEFEKWWGKFDCSIDIDCAGLSCDNCEVIRKETWKAALKWVLENCLVIEKWSDVTVFDSKKVKRELEQLNQSNSQSNNSPQSNTPGH